MPTTQPCDPTNSSNSSQPPRFSSQPPCFSDDDWDDLLDTIVRGQVIPLVGDGAMTFGESNSSLHPTVAAKLIERLSSEEPDKSERLNALALRRGSSLTLSEVVCEYLLLNGVAWRVYSRVGRILNSSEFRPGPTLQQLAEIRDFQLYLSTSTDSLLEAALELARGKEPTSLSFYPNAPKKDLPQRGNQLNEPTVYHLLGRSPGAPGEFVVWEEDLLDFLTELPRHLGTDTMRNLSADLKSQSLLAIGLGFSDWVLRLVLRIARQERLSRVTHYSWLADGCEQSNSTGAVVFFGMVSQTIRVIECGSPARFVEELHRRWRLRSLPRPTPSIPQPSPPRPGGGLVFISYAREDVDMARRIEKALRDQGCRVFFDRDRLGTAMNYHHELERQISEQCAMFVSIVSPFTESTPGDHYFRRERNWAARRLEGFSPADQPKFYLPVLVHDELPPKLEREPPGIRGFDWIHCPSGHAPPEFCKRVYELQCESGGAS